MKVVCPKCGSDQLSANQKGFSGTKAVGGALLLGGVGLLAGTSGSKKVICTCLVCGNQFKAGEGKVIYEPGENPPAAVVEEQEKMARRKKINKTILIVFAAIFLLIILIAAFS